MSVGPVEQDAFLQQFIADCRRAADVNTPPAELAALAWSHHLDVRRAVAVNASTPTDALHDLATMPSEYNRIQEDVASSPSATEKTLTYLCGSKDWQVRLRLTSHPNLPLKVAMKLARDKVWTIQTTLAKNQKLPAKVYEKLAGSADVHTRRTLASNPSAPATVFALLATDCIEDVRNCVAQNPSCPPLVKMWLTSDYSKSMTLEEFLGAAGDNHGSDIPFTT